MAYDTRLAGRIREHVGARRGVTEKPMFGGLCFLLDGKMFAGIVGEELMARVGPDAHDEAVARPHARIMDFTGRPMRGYVFVGPDGMRTKPSLARWLDQCAEHVAKLPAKAGRKRRAASPRKRRAMP